MAEKFSTGLRNTMLAEAPFRKIFADAIINIYSGTAPATADDAVVGTLLCKVTKASAEVSAGETSISKQAIITMSSGTTGQTVIVAINGTDYTYTIPAGETGDLDLIARSVALMLDAIPAVEAIADGTNGNGDLFIRSRIKGLTFTIAKGGGGGGGTASWTLTDSVVSNSRCDALQFGDPTDGVIPKASEVWSGVNLAAGTASWFRLVLPDDTGSQSTTECRVQGAVSTSGAELNLSSVNFPAGATTTINNFNVTMPAQ